MAVLALLLLPQSSARAATSAADGVGAAVTEKPQPEAKVPAAPTEPPPAGERVDGTSAPALRSKPGGVGGHDAAFERALSVRTQAAIDQLSAAGKRLFERRQYGQSARELATAYAYKRNPELLFAIARSCRKADLDFEALAAYQQFTEQSADPAQRAEAEEELKTLRARIDDVEFGVAQSTREHLEIAKRNFQGGQFLIAAQEYALAYALKRLPRLLFNIAQSYRRADRAEDAYIFYARFLSEEPQSPLRKETLGYLTELRAVAFKPPVYKRAWFWSTIGAGAALVAAGAAGLAVGLKPQYPSTDVSPRVVMFSLKF